MWLGLGCALVLYNAVVAAVFAFDKRRAKSGGRRVPERTLLGLALFGGAGGAWVAMRVFRHKTRKPRFAWGVPLLFLLQLAALAAAGRSPAVVAQWRDAGCARSSLPFSSLDGRLRR